MSRKQYIFETNTVNGGFLVDRRSNQIVGTTSNGVDQYFATVKENDVTGVVELSAGGVAVISSQVHPAYFCHLTGAGLTTDDPTWYDASVAGNNATRGANLSIAQMGAAAGYASTIAPVTGTLDSILHLPSLNYDFNGGESLLVYWRGKMTAPVATANMMGDTESNFRSGFKVRVATNGKIDVVLYSSVGPVSLFGPAGTGVIADGTVHEFAFLIDGVNKKFYTYEDGALLATANGFGLSGCDTTNSNDLCIGASYKVPTNASGIAVASRTLAVLRFGATQGAPDPSKVLSAIKRLRANPARLFTVSDF